MRRLNNVFFYGILPMRFYNSKRNIENVEVNLLILPQI